MKLRVERKYVKENYTIGNLYIDGKFFCNTLEDKVRDINKNGKFDNGETKVYGQTAIPYGTYEVIVNMSPKFKRELPRLLNVPHFEGILIHRGNTDKDSSGCILLGENKIKGQLINSTKYEVELTKIIKAELSKRNKVYIEII